MTSTARGDTIAVFSRESIGAMSLCAKGIAAMLQEKGYIRIIETAEPSEARL